MSAEFPKLDISQPSDLDVVMSAIQSHAMALLEPQLRADGLGRDEKAKKAAQAAIERWVAAAKVRMMDNILVNGLTFKELARQSGNIEPFDEALSHRVQSLSEQADVLTAQAITARKEVPALRAQAIEERGEAMEQWGAGPSLGRERQERERQAEQWSGLDVESGIPKLERADEVSTNLRRAVADIEELQTSLLENASAAQEQTRLVQRLRSM